MEFLRFFLFVWEKYAYEYANRKPFEIYSLGFTFENNLSKRGFIRKISDLGISWYYSKTFSHVSTIN